VIQQSKSLKYEPTSEPLPSSNDHASRNTFENVETESPTTAACPDFFGAKSVRFGFLSVTTWAALVHRRGALARRVDAGRERERESEGKRGRQGERDPLVNAGEAVLVSNASAYQVAIVLLTWGRTAVLPPTLESS